LPNEHGESEYDQPVSDMDDLKETYNQKHAEYEGSDAGAHVADTASGAAAAGSVTDTARNMSADAGSADPGSSDAGSADAGSADAGSADAGTKDSMQSGKKE
jgi:hypothetical protein